MTWHGWINPATILPVVCAIGLLREITWRSRMKNLKERMERTVRLTEITR